ncbi:MAG TPA: universal stress protein, partial [Polyangia bacterium]|nr:universal stress protein [Polyangia bacterium]
EDAEDELKKLRARAEATGLRVTTHLRGESIVFGLLEAVTQLLPQLLVVGSHGRHGIARALLGSVSESLARRSPVPVLIVPAPERETLAQATAWSCLACGHIFGDGEPSNVCARCGESPARWTSAPLTHEPVDGDEPAVGEGAACEVAPIATQDPITLFATSPAGSGGDATNAELRIRRF